ncbi:MAG: hypothetical protein Q8K43_00115 [Sulfurimicrobium sp.]|nr:hypothetical protein [Sulfurimicrobium sp.]
MASALPCVGEEADTASKPSLTLKGFGTLGIARSDNNTVRFVRDLSYPDGLSRNWSGKLDSLVGLQANIQLSEQTEGVMQVVSRYRYDGTYTPEVTWAFLRHDVSPDFSLRAGRLGTEFYMRADSRLVGYANLTVRPPPDYYGALVFSYVDGLDISATTPMTGGLLRGKFYAGASPEKTPFVTQPWDLAGSLIVGGHVDYLYGPWQVRVGHTQIHFENETPMNALVESMGGPANFLTFVPELSVAGKSSRFDSLGVLYDEGPIQLQLMLSQTRHESTQYENSKAGYAIAGYRLGHVTPYLGYSRVKSSAKLLTSPPPAFLASLTSNLMSQTHSDQHTLFLGGRWDLQHNLALKGQVDWIRGTPNSLFPFRGDDTPAAWNGNMRVFSLTLDFMF